ncbi:MFS transporter [Eremomyces bilateralis CBS 781.70]|uniref:MFS transporter n=1 Tax=Eremomyces bilateralis CBS 781.70 TaxID=1392243 RepID=A0A6G1FYU1_9PEZI|nr:MFS transporter [Eremomyces bilateralis CBS 781.70]KAF1810953.1 MFS transporter [Eremomyces bilateralis CBS 781.70]
MPKWPRPFGKSASQAGSVILLSKETQNQPLGLQNIPARTSVSSLPSSIRTGPPREPTKKTADGKIILDPQPSESPNDPLNWSSLRRDAALVFLGFYCMIGGGMTPVLAAGFNDVAETFDVTVPQVALTTGLYMMGMGVGGVIMSPTAILFGKRPVYLITSLLFVGTSIWCALANSYISLLVGRIFQGIAISPVECLPSATIAEIFFLHERAYRLGIYSMLLLGGKNIVPLVSAAIIQAKGWRWVFWVVAMVVGGCFFLLFFFLPETFWDRTPHAHKSLRLISRAQSFFRPGIDRRPSHLSEHRLKTAVGEIDGTHEKDGAVTMDKAGDKTENRVGFAEGVGDETRKDSEAEPATPSQPELRISPATAESTGNSDGNAEESGPISAATPVAISSPPWSHPPGWEWQPPQTPTPPPPHLPTSDIPSVPGSQPPTPGAAWTHSRRSAPAKTYWQTLSPWPGRLSGASWPRAAIRPLILFAYPAILWSAVIYSLSVGWLIVLSESVAHIYQNSHSYNFTALQTGLIYLSPFVGGILGTAVAGKVSDWIVLRFTKRNDGVYEPEFRLVMAAPVAVFTTIGLMGFGWSAEERNNWIVPTIFFGAISFGCNLGSTTAITFAVDSYRQYAGEALVTLNFSKNIFHGLIFSLFFTSWLESDGAKIVFIACGVIQLGCCLATIPMFIYGKRMRMWTVRKNLMEKF